MEDKLTISKENLNKILTEQAKVLVGVSMRKFELLENEKQYNSKSIQEKEYRKTLKRLIKEQIYESFRNLKSIIIAFSAGVEFKESNPKQN